jgi:predicted nucleic acid-binding protein
MTASTDNSPRALVDTNVLVYAYDRDDPRKHTVAQELIEDLSNQGRLHRQTYGACTAAISRTGVTNGGLFQKTENGGPRTAENRWLRARIEVRLVTTMFEIHFGR